eukprot:7583810-Pyramimonas_sp.AAC.1
MVCVLVKFTPAESISNAFDWFVNGVLSASRINVINMLGREQIIARLELIVVRRGSEAKSSGRSSELK